MDKETFRIPLPDDRTIQAEIRQIVCTAAKQQEKESFLSYLQAMYRQIGIRHLFYDRLELALILIIVSALLGLIFFGPKPDRVNAPDVYAFLFLTSPIFFLVCSVYTYSKKIWNATYEVEMACKFNVYQVIAFRMLAFSVVSVLVNTAMIFFITEAYQEIQFNRAFMISNTALFTFSLLFLYAMMKRRSALVAAMVVVAWVLGNLGLRFAGKMLYIDILQGMPLIVYAIVLAGSLSCYLRHVNKLIHANYSEGAL
ncbi:hypothetical protein [Brevibacillus massiliensis]|uniref:hypothetical protein n=1 Tax=Brevibacillus massiliensis TaxID=1118054 RepID=UPI00030B9EE5|nr:hypothetical protein [Brevibacillus massiliensis]